MLKIENLMKYIYSFLFLLLICFFSVFQVSEFESAFVIRFGRIIKTINMAGLHLKMPFIDDVASFDKRILQTYLPDKEVIALDQKRLVVDVYAKYKIKDVRKFYESVRSEQNANIKISSMLDSAMRQVIATYPLTSLLTNDRVEIMNKIQEVMSVQGANFGIEVVDVRIIKADLPSENSEAIFKRMNTDRQKEAKSLRSSGVEEATGIRANADRQSIQIKSEANMNANIVKGEADAKAMKIYANAFSKDGDFYNFWRTLEAYKKVLPQQNMVITEKDNSFFEVIKGKKK
jgi:membrane protease subunit HflC